MSNHTTYQSNANAVTRALTELERAAFKDVAKFLRKEIKGRVPVDKGTLKKNVGSWVKKKDACLAVGVYDRARAQKKGLKYAFHAHLVEFGNRTVGARPFLKSSVMDNVNQIRIIMGHYLQAIEDENRALGLIQEDEEVAND